MASTDFFIPAYFAATIAISIFIAMLVLISGIKQQRAEYNALALLSSLVAVYQYTTMQYHFSSNIDDALYWVRYQASVVIILKPLYFFAFARWANFPRLGLWTAALTLFSALQLFYNLSAEYSIRFSDISGLRTIHLWDAESINVIEGTRSAIGLTTDWVSAVLLLLTFLLIRRFYLTKYKQLAYLLAISVIFQIIALVVGYKINQGELNFMYISSMPMLFLNIGVCVLAAFEFRNQARRYEKLHEKTINLEQAFSELAKGNTLSNSMDFYDQMLKSLYELTGMDYIFIGLKNNNAATTKVDAISMVHQGKSIAPFSYDLAGTPCANVFDNNMCIHKDNVQRQFPKDTLLTDMDIESYIGTPLQGEHSELIGLLAMLHSKPINMDSQVLAAIEIYASRAAAEIRRDTVEAKLRRVAYIDHATGLANKLKLYEVVKTILQEKETQKGQALLMLVDINRFTQINLDLGYDTGELVLAELGRRFQAIQNENVFFARSGADEFAALYYTIDSLAFSYMSQQWERLRKVLCAPIQVGESSMSVEFSVGAVAFPQLTGKKYDIIQCAESALQQSKQKSDGDACLFDIRLLDEVERRRQIDTQLRAALKDTAQLFMVYQPKTDSEGKLLAVEALLRWNSPHLGNVAPDEFIPIAERNNSIVELDAWVIDSVCQQIKRWKEQGFPCKVAINVSAAQFLGNSFAQFVLSKLDEYHLIPSDIELEITEHGLLNDIERAKLNLNSLREKGVSIALDDFGTGYSSLSYLRELPLDVLKIDKSFVDKIDDASTAQLIQTIITIGKQQSLTIVAEGAEDASQVNLLSKMGCDSFQGYYFSKPILGKNIPQWRFNRDIA